MSLNDAWLRARLATVIHDFTTSLDHERLTSATRFEPNIEQVNPEKGIRNVEIGGSWERYTNEELYQFFAENMLLDPRQLEDGSWCAKKKLAYTWSICCDVTPTTCFAYRWCFKDEAEADYFLATMKEFDEVPVKRDSLQGHRYNATPRLVITDELGIKKW